MGVLKNKRFVKRRNCLDCGRWCSGARCKPCFERAIKEGKLNNKRGKAGQLKTKLAIINHLIKCHDYTPLQANRLYNWINDGEFSK